MPTQMFTYVKDFPLCDDIFACFNRSWFDGCFVHMCGKLFVRAKGNRIFFYFYLPCWCITGVNAWTNKMWVCSHRTIKKECTWCRVRIALSFVTNRFFLWLYYGVKLEKRSFLFYSIFETRCWIIHFNYISCLLICFLVWIILEIFLNEYFIIDRIYTIRKFMIIYTLWTKLNRISHTTHNKR